MARSSDRIFNIDHAFNLYIAQVFRGIPIGPEQIKELKKAWFGSAAWILHLQLGVVSQLPEDEGEAVMEGFFSQLRSFAADLPDNGQGGMTDEPVSTSVVIEKEQ
jgi:hypothetical protein